MVLFNETECKLSNLLKDYGFYEDELLKRKRLKISKRQNKKSQINDLAFYIDGASSYSHTKSPWHYLRR